MYYRRRLSIQEINEELARRCNITQEFNNSSRKHISTARELHFFILLHYNNDILFQTTSNS